MQELADIYVTDGQIRQHARLGIHNLETYLAKYAAFHQWLNERGLQMTQYHDRLQAGEFLPGAQPHYAEGENPSPVAEAEAPAEPQPEQPQPEQPQPDAQPEPQPEPMPEAPAEEVIVEETVVEEAPAEEAPPA